MSCRSIFHLEIIGYHWRKEWGKRSNPFVGLHDLYILAAGAFGSWRCALNKVEKGALLPSLICWPNVRLKHLEICSYLCTLLRAALYQLEIWITQLSRDEDSRRFVPFESLSPPTILNWTNSNFLHVTLYVVSTRTKFSRSADQLEATIEKLCPKDIYITWLLFNDHQQWWIQ